MRDDPHRGQGADRPWRPEYHEDRDTARFGGYAGQEYGMEGGREHRRGPREGDRSFAGQEQRETWRPQAGAPYGDLELNARNLGIEEFGAPHDYAYHPEQGHEFDPEYLSWRDQQMRAHDRDYDAWRRDRERAYDEDYRRFRDQQRRR